MMTRHAVGALLALLFLGAPVSTQDVVSISGVVTTRADGAAVPGALISVSGSDTTVTTDSNGQYTLTLPRAAVRGTRVQLKVDALGLPTHAIDVVVDGTLTANVALNLGATWAW